MNSIELDFNGSMTFSQLAEELAPYDLTAQIVELEGPGGGNPSIRLVGSYKQVVEYLIDYTNGDSNDLRFFVSLID